MTSRIRGMIFDKDGTLFDFAATWEAWAEAFLLKATSGDRPRAARIGAAIGFDLETRKFDPGSVVIAGTPAQIADALQGHFPDLPPGDFVDLLNSEAEMAPQIEVVPLRPFLADLLARGLQLGVATNDGYKPAMAHLEQAGVADQFGFIAGFDSGFGGKPAPGQLNAFCAQTGLSPGEVVMVGDSLHDLDAGRAAGMQTIGVLTGMAHADVLTDRCDAVLPDIGHIPSWLDTS